MAADSNGEVLDVAIVGAGVSGVYSGWRLLTDPPPGRPVPTVQVFEQSHTIGGRLLSVQPPGIPGVFCELGGMRYLSSQALIRSLIEDKRNLETRPFVVAMPENLNYVRGQRFRNSDLANHVNVPFELSWSERGVTVDTVLASVLNQIIPGVTKMEAADLREFLAEFKVDGRPIFDWGVWNLLSRGMSHEQADRVERIPVLHRRVVAAGQARENVGSRAQAGLLKWLTTTGEPSGLLPSASKWCCQTIQPYSAGPSPTRVCTYRAMTHPLTSPSG